jgi:transposase
MYYVGIDWADQKHDIAIVDQKGQMVGKPKTIKKNYHGFEKINAMLRTLSDNPQNFKIGIETPHNLIVDFLVDQTYPLFVLFPGLMPQLRKRYRVSAAHNDPFDAYVLADSLRTDKQCWRQVKFCSELTRQIRILARDHHTLIDKQVSLRNSLRSTLNLYYPEYLQFFGDICCDTSLAFIEAYPDFREAQKLNQRQIKQFFKEQHYNNAQAAARVYNLLRQKPIAVAPALQETKKLKAVIVSKQLRQLKSDIKLFQIRLTDLLEQHPDGKIFLSYPGVGHINAARLISFFGDDRTRFESVKELQGLAGTCPVTDQSGKNRRGTIYFRRACNKYYRDLMYQVAFTSLLRCQWAKHYYKKHRQRGKKHSHALRCLANIHLRILFAMWKKRTSYDHKIFLAQREKNKLSG